ncbi:L-aspartate oxidase [Limisalsivibrio acetivorans]|uniref:L-aspartate oxidase n=1 Tax=Limisalsivibrio acetivorans TaxID=1304888 RepID=UPI0003B62BAF|nr:L-aspartate oxidase [Limisalsivibrio acetivorans]
MQHKKFDYIVLGSGVAGLRAAIELAAHGDVAVITKCFLGESSSEYAQGGVAVVLNDDDDIFLHIDDTLKAGDGLCDRDAVLTLVEEGPRYIRELIAWGAQFDMHGGNLSFTREAAHSVNRIIHAQGDATGHEIVRSLKEHAGKFLNIYRVEYMYAIDFLVEDGRVTGVLTVDEKTGEQFAYYSKAVVVATGGAGRLFNRTTNPEVATGDGAAMAFRAYAELEDMEFYQFHPTALHFPGAPAFLLSESMRGEGAYLKNQNNERFCTKYHEDGELAPRDVVSRSIFFEMQELNTDHMYLDLTHLDKDFVKNRFPKIHSTCLEYGIDITLDLIPVSPAAHYYMGGIKTDTEGRTALKGLYACGEAACTGVHGANRLASNSLLEGVVYGGRSAKAAVRECNGFDILETEPEDRPLIKEEDYTKALRDIQNTMWLYVSVSRNEEGLKKAIDFLENYLVHFEGKRPADRKTAELRNLAEVGLMMAKAALARPGSRGGHYRDDLPERMSENTHIYFSDAEYNPRIR